MTIPCLADWMICDYRFLFFITVMKTSTFNKHFQAYIIEPTPNTKVIFCTQLLNPFPLHIHRISSGGSSLSLIICKHHICGTLS